MHIALMRHIKHYFIFRSVKHIVESHCSLNHTEIGSHMAAMSGEFLNQSGAKLSAEQFELTHIHSLDIGGRMDCRQVYIHNERIFSVRQDLTHLKYNIYHPHMVAPRGMDSYLSMLTPAIAPSRPARLSAWSDRMLRVTAQVLSNSCDITLASDPLMSCITEFID